MRLRLLIVIAVFANCHHVHSQFILNAGDVYTRSFDSLPFVGCGFVPFGARNSSSFSFTLDPASIQIGDSFQMEIVPFAPVEWHGPQSPQYLFVPSAPAGPLRLTGLSGSVTIESITMSQGFINYVPPSGPLMNCVYEETFVPVPEPNTLAFIILTAPFLLLNRRRRRKSER